MKRSQFTLTALAIVAVATTMRGDEPAAVSSGTQDSGMYFHGPRYGLGTNDPWMPKPVPVQADVVFQPTASPAVMERESKRKNSWEEINAKLNMPVTVKLDKVPLREGATQVVTQIGVPFNIDLISMEEAGIAIDDPVSLDLPNVSAATALRRMLDGRDLTTFIDGEVLVLTTREKAEEFLTTHVYSVSDLAVTTDGGDVMRGVESLMTTIQQTTDGPWLDTDGTGGTMSPHFHGGVVALAIRQTDEIHREIESLLYQLRQARSPAAQRALENAPGNDVSHVEREILRLRDEVQDTAEGVRSRIGSLKIQELTPELRAKIEELQNGSRLDRFRSEMRALTPSVRERLEQIRRDATGLSQPDLESLESDLELQEPAVDEAVLELENRTQPTTPDAVEP